MLNKILLCICLIAALPVRIFDSFMFLPFFVDKDSTLTLFDSRIVYKYILLIHVVPLIVEQDNPLKWFNIFIVSKDILTPSCTSILCQARWSFGVAKY